MFSACGKVASGFTAAMNQLSFGAPPGGGAGDACGRCFSITGNRDPYSPQYTGPFKNIVVKVTDLCPGAANENWCGQSTSNLNNQVGVPVQYVLVVISKTRPHCIRPASISAKRVELPQPSSPPVGVLLISKVDVIKRYDGIGRGALTGTYSEVPCNEWSSNSATIEGVSLWNGACLLGESAPNWPSVACGNQGQSQTISTKLLLTRWLVRYSTVLKARCHPNSARNF
jgi:hypothetical protein